MPKPVPWVAPSSRTSWLWLWTCWLDISLASAVASPKLSVKSLWASETSMPGARDALRQSLPLVLGEVSLACHVFLRVLRWMGRDGPRP